MNFLKFKYYFWRLKKNYKSFLSTKKKYNLKNEEKRKFINFFIRDEEDKILNKKVLDNFDKQIQKYKRELYKKENIISKNLFSLGIADLNYINILYDFKISEEDSIIIKESLKLKIGNNF